MQPSIAIVLFTSYVTSLAEDQRWEVFRSVICCSSYILHIRLWCTFICCVPTQHGIKNQSPCLLSCWDYAPSIVAALCYVSYVHQRNLLVLTIFRNHTAGKATVRVLFVNAVQSGARARMQWLLSVSPLQVCGQLFLHYIDRCQYTKIDFYWGLNVFLKFFLVYVMHSSGVQHVVL